MPSRARRAVVPRRCRGTCTSSAWSHCSPRWPMGADERGREVRAGALRAWLAPGGDPHVAIGPDGGPDPLLTGPDCRGAKLQRKGMVGRVPTAAGSLYVKRYNVHAWRIALGSIVRASPARRAFVAARTLAALGFGVPDVVAAVEERRLGMLRRSFFVTREVAGALTADRYWAGLGGAPAGERRRLAVRPA